MGVKKILRNLFILTYNETDCPYLQKYKVVHNKIRVFNSETHIDSLEIG